MEDPKDFDAVNFPRRARQRIGDPFLQMLLDFIGDRTEFSLDLSVNGQRIHGTAISRDRWFKLWREEVESVGGGGMAAVFAEFDEAELFIHEDEQESDLPRRIYLMNAKIGVGAGVQLVRVQLDAVDAWSMGVSPGEYPLSARTESGNPA